MRVQTTFLGCLTFALGAFACGGDDNASTSSSGNADGASGTISIDGAGGSAGAGGGAGAGGSAGVGGGNSTVDGPSTPNDASIDAAGDVSITNPAEASADSPTESGDSTSDAGIDSPRESASDATLASDGASEAGGGDGGVTCSFPSNRVQQASLSTDLVAWYCFDDQAAVGKDCSGNLRDLTAGSGVTTIADGFGRAVELNGNNTYYLERTDPAFTPGLSDWTISVWMKLRGNGDYGQAISWYRCGANPSCFGDAAAYSLGITNSFHEALWRVRFDDAQDIPIGSPRYSVIAPCWHLVTGVISQSEGKSLIYLDGVLSDVAAAPATGLTTGPINVPFEIGRTFVTGWGVPEGFFSGLLDDVRVYKRALSVSEIQALYAGKY